MRISITGKQENKQRKATADTRSHPPAPAMPRAVITPPPKKQPHHYPKRPETQSPTTPLPRPPTRKSHSTPTTITPNHPMTKQIHNG
jgi:hypothetical protein